MSAARRAGGHWNDAYPFVRLHQPTLYVSWLERSRLNPIRGLRAHVHEERVQKAAQRYAANVGQAFMQLAAIGEAVGQGCPRSRPPPMNVDWGWIAANRQPEGSCAHGKVLDVASGCPAASAAAAESYKPQWFKEASSFLTRARQRRYFRTPPDRGGSPAPASVARSWGPRSAGLLRGSGSPR